MTTKDEALRVAREALERAESAMNYTQATVSPGNQRDRKGAWVEVHGGWAESSYRQLQLAIGATRSALRTIALAVEGPRTLCPVTYCHRSIEERDTAGCDHCNHPAAPAVQSVALGEPSAERAAWLADKIVVYGGYAKEAAQMLRRWPAASLRIAGADGDKEVPRG